MSSSADTLSVCTANIAFAPGAAALAQPKAATRLKKKKKIQKLFIFPPLLMCGNLLTVFHTKTEVKLASVVIFYS